MDLKAILEFRCDQAGLAFATTAARSSSSAGPLVLGQLAGWALPSPRPWIQRPETAQRGTVMRGMADSSRIQQFPNLRLLIPWLRLTPRRGRCIIHACLGARRTVCCGFEYEVRVRAPLVS